MKKKEAEKIVDRALKKGVEFGNKTHEIKTLYVVGFENDYYPAVELSFSNRNEMRIMKDNSGFFSTHIIVTPFIALVIPKDGDRVNVLKNSGLTITLYKPKGIIRELGEEIGTEVGLEIGSTILESALSAMI